MASIRSSRNGTGSGDRRGSRADYGPLILQLLSSYDVWEAQPGRYRSSCPFHKGENVTTFSVFSNGFFNCFKCGAKGDMASLLAHVRRLSIHDAREFLGSNVIPVFHSMDDLPQMPTWEERKKKEKYPTIDESVLGAYRRHCPNYLINRGFSAQALKEWEIGYDVQRFKIVIPVRDYRRRLVGLTYRLDFDNDKEQPAKYWHDNFLKSYHLYGFHHYAGKEIKRLFLVEGQLDAVRMWQLRYCAVATMGSDLSAEQADLILHQSKAKQIVLAFDNDEAGEKARKLALKRLLPTAYGPTLTFLKYPKKDPGELNETDKLSLVPWWKDAASLLCG